MNWSGIWAKAQMDMLVVRRSRAVVIPLVVVPVFLLILAPLGVIFGAANEQAASDMMRDFAHFFDQMPGTNRETIEAYGDDQQQMVVLATIYLLAPLYLILPLMVSAVIAADSFAGEKERKTLEALLYSHLTDRELLFGKMLAAWIPAVLVNLL